MYDDRGSVWRKWDLHVHTPYTRLNNNFNDLGIEDYANAIGENDLAAVGITNYFLFREDELVEIEDSLDDTFLTPNIEFRINDKNKEGDYIHIHVLFNPSIDTEEIIDVLNRIKLNNVPEDNVFINQDSLGRYPTDAITVSLDELINKLKKHFKPKEDYLIASCASGYGNFRPDNTPRFRNLALKIDKLSHLIFGTEQDRDFFLNKGEQGKKRLDQGLSPKPVLLCSDAHSKENIGSKFTWIKADPTFEGLRQITIEPKERIYIGREPKKVKVVKSNSTKFLSGLVVDKAVDADESEIWFENLTEIPLNHDLVAVIGNKGSGKSAFTDIIALVGKTKNYGNCSFLSPKKFRNPKRNKAKSFEATVTWQDGNSDGPVNLDIDPEIYEKEMVKYLPQNFIEELCNPVTADERKLFETEIKDVIFSWVPESERYGKTSLDEIIDYRSDVVNRKVDELRRKINKTNKKIIDLENKLTDDYKKEVEENLNEKKKELESHKENKPSEVEKPEELKEDEEFQTIHEELGACKQRIEELENRKKEYQNLLVELNNRIAAADRLIERIKMIDQYADDIKLELADELNLLDVDFDRIVKVDIKLKGIENNRSRFIRIKNSVNEFIDGDTEESLNIKLTSLNEKREELENKLDEPDRLYQEYLTELEKWKKKKDKIIGTESTVDSLKHLEKELEKIEGKYPEQLDALEDERKDYVREIHAKYQELKTLYSNLYEPVSDFISDHEELLEDFSLSFDVSIESKEFKNKFLNRIHLGVIGSFYGESEANKYLSETHDSVNFNEVEELINFLNTVYQDLHVHRETGEDLKIKKQLKGNETKLSLYDFLFGLEYLEPTYQLKLDEKELYQLSPGERGTLLLIFYLLIDRDIRPLIIDQPEENLDNETVYKVLVRCIREAKKRRQVIIVTHNPNLAVVCDAEQIIVADIDKKNENEVFYETGSIENPDINERIINILEGTRPAFDNRDAKYIA